MARVHTAVPHANRQGEVQLSNQILLLHDLFFDARPWFNLVDHDQLPREHL